MPFNFIPAPRRLPLFWLFFGLSLAFFAVFNGLDQPLRTSAAPAGIVSYELAGSPAAAGAMLASWDEAARLAVAFGLGLDFLFMPIYATALSLAILLAADRRRSQSWIALGKFLAWGAFLAAGLDVVENISLLRILLDGPNSGLPQLAAGCAALKFVFLILGVGYALLGWLFKQKR
ncbi:MAG: hypothetical protein RBS68_01535 [Anaerolineales bacterium]|jgi:hypothetical protein|nr:hypothetical protein [Anaerolineales bacterium]